MVTGASSGFGSAISRALAATGYRVFGTSTTPAWDFFGTHRVCRAVLPHLRANTVQRAFNAVRPFLPQAVSEFLIRDAHGLK